MPYGSLKSTLQFAEAISDDFLQIDNQAQYDFLLVLKFCKTTYIGLGL